MATGSAKAAPSARTARRPNILFILADDLGYADLSCYGRREYRTPNLDRLAATGIRLTHGYSNSPVCSPTRVALMTGRYQYRQRAGLEEPIVRKASGVGLPPSHPTLPSLLRASGYSTALVGKWHMGWPPEYGPLKSGYERFFGILPGAADYFSHGGDGVAVPSDTSLMEGDTPVERVGYITDLLAERAIAEIRSAATSLKPFFISLHFTAPHWPWQGPSDRAVKGWSKDLFHTDGGSLEKYGELVVSLDAAIGRVLAQLERAGMAEDTIVVFTSDNGGERFSDNWPFRGEKTDLLEGGIRVPLLVRWPTRFASERTLSQVVVSMDWLPTLLAAAGASSHPNYKPDGEDLLSVLTGSSPLRERTIFWRYKGHKQAAVRKADWKYFRRGETESLFDLSADPRERADLKDKAPEILTQLREAHRKWDATMLPYPADSISATHS
ncbi:MAG: sulfatase-like hydrolase/transferase [Sphingomonas sp.]|nr:sulfatase-like hydrolase/transferase [Sphingomonas sp.]